MWTVDRPSRPDGGPDEADPGADSPVLKHGAVGRDGAHRGSNHPYPPGSGPPSRRQRMDELGSLRSRRSDGLHEPPVRILLKPLLEPRPEAFPVTDGVDSDRKEARSGKREKLAFMDLLLSAEPMMK